MKAWIAHTLRDAANHLREDGQESAADTLERLATEGRAPTSADQKYLEWKRGRDQRNEALKNLGAGI